MPKPPNPAAPLNRFRTPIARGLKAAEKDQPRVVRDGGDYGAGVIYAASIITRGEALGHRMWIDGEMVSQVYTAIDDAGEEGLKARFTHPSLSADGLGSYLGRLKNPQQLGDQTFADIHIAKAARKAPDGDLGAYVMDLAEHDPDQFGMSIVFTADRLAEEKFELDNSTADPDDGEPRFKSPDPDNVNNYRHARLAKLHGADAVDEPAANPRGLFSAHQELAAEAERLLDYALRDGERPEVTQLSVDPDRLTAFVHRYLHRHGLTISKEGTMSTKLNADAGQDTKPAATDGSAATEGGSGSPPAENDGKTSQSAAGAAGNSGSGSARQFTGDELRNWSEEFGAHNAVAWLSEGISVEEARKRYNAQLREQLHSSQEKTKELETRLSQAHTGEETPLGAGKDESSGAAGQSGGHKDNFSAATAAIAARMPQGK